MRILVTGGGGFIGSHLVKALTDKGHDVFIVDDFSRGDLKQNEYPKVTVYQADVRYGDDFSNIVHGVKPDEVIHLAYINGTKTFYEKPAKVLEVAVKGMVNVLDACKTYGIRRMMLASSSEVCRALVGHMDEEAPLVIPDPFNPRYSYSAGKIISEMMAIHSGLFDWLSIIRPYNIYGPGMSKGHVIPDFNGKLSKCLPGLRTTFNIIGSGSETRSFCYIDDFIDAVMLIREKGKHNEIYNVGTEEETTIRQLAVEMAKIYGIDRLDVVDGDQLREGSIKRRRPDINKLLELGYTPKVSLIEGLRRVMCQ